MSDDMRRLRKAARGWINPEGDEFQSSHVCWSFERSEWPDGTGYANGEVWVRSCYGKGAELEIDPDDEGLAKLDRVLELLQQARADLVEVMDAELVEVDPGGEA